MPKKVSNFLGIFLLRKQKYDFAFKLRLVRIIKQVKDHLE